MTHTKASVSELMTANENNLSLASERGRPDPANVVAKLTVTFDNLTTWVIEVHEDATYHDFYRMYHLAFNSDLNLNKIPFSLPTKNRSYNTRWSQNFEPGLSFVLAEIKRTYPNEVTRGDISVYNKTLYDHLLACAPDELGKGLPSTGVSTAESHERFPWISTMTDVQRQEINVRAEPSDAY